MTRTFVLAFQLLVLFWQIADVDSSQGCRLEPFTKKSQVIHLLHPAAPRRCAYILPMAPIPIKPIVGWHSVGEEGVTDGDKLIGNVA